MEAGEEAGEETCAPDPWPSTLLPWRPLGICPTRGLDSHSCAGNSLSRGHSRADAATGVAVFPTVEKGTLAGALPSQARGAQPYGH